MPLKKLETLNTKSLHKNPYWEYRLDNYVLPNGDTGEYHYVHSPGSAMVVPVDENGRLVLVKQFRYLWKKESIEFPAGGMKYVDPLVTAKNELAEEANLGASSWKFVGEFNPFNGATDEIATVYLASGLSRIEKEKDASEEFEVIKMTIPEFQAAIDGKEIWDGMTLAAWMLARPAVLDYIGELER
ncbi:MAG TPA: NUDIX hydrolase [Candidatus Acidoferrales bacterium]|nr:NUDIX hydrolase [Candidatus Acidoferrales bacterium]